VGHSGSQGRPECLSKRRADRAAALEEQAPHRPFRQRLEQVAVALQARAHIPCLTFSRAVAKQLPLAVDSGKGLR